MTNLTVSAALLKDVPIGGKNAVLPQPPLRKHTINCLTFEKSTRQPYNDNLCLFRALAAICMALNDWKKKLQNCSIFSSKKCMG